MAQAATWCSVLSGRGGDRRLGAVEDLREAVAVLDASGTPGARRTADALRAVLAGRRFEEAAGIALPRGGAHQRPDRLLAKRRRDEALRALAASMPGGPTQQARALLTLIELGAPDVAEAGSPGAPLPRSAKQLVRIIREAR